MTDGLAWWEVLIIGGVSLFVISFIAAGACVLWFWFRMARRIERHADELAGRFGQDPPG